MTPAPSPWRSWFQAGPFSSRGFVVRAGLLVVFYAGCELAGLREHTTFLSGTAVQGHSFSVVTGVTYLAAYFGFVLAVPILLLAAALLTGWQRWGRKHPAPARTTPPPTSSAP